MMVQTQVQPQNTGMGTTVTDTGPGALWNWIAGQSVQSSNYWSPSQPSPTGPPVACANWNESGEVCLDAPPVVNYPTQPLSTTPDIREIPSWCDSVPFASFADACQPYTQAELSRMTASQAARLVQACLNMGGTQEECVGRGQQLETNAAASAAVAASSDPYGQCQYAASQAHSLGSKLFGAAVYCNPDGSVTSFDPSLWLMGGAALLLLLLVRR